jgi:hypothetical protein
MEIGGVIMVVFLSAIGFRAAILFNDLRNRHFGAG